MPSASFFPTDVHRAVAETIVARYGRVPGVQAILLVNSCARGMGTPQSDLDMAVLVDPGAAIIEELQAQWEELCAGDRALQRLRELGRFTAVHLDWIDGVYAPTAWDDGGGPDAFEISVGNHVAYSAPLLCNGSRYEELRSAWLPYYDESLRRQRLTMVREACRYDLDFIPFYVGRAALFSGLRSLV